MSCAREQGGGTVPGMWTAADGRGRASPGRGEGPTSPVTFSKVQGHFPSHGGRRRRGRESPGPLCSHCLWTLGAQTFLGTGTAT